MQGIRNAKDHKRGDFETKSFPVEEITPTQQWEWGSRKSSGGRRYDCCKTTPRRTNGVLRYSDFEK